MSLQFHIGGQWAGAPELLFGKRKQHMSILSIILLSAGPALADAGPSLSTNLAQPSAPAALSERAYPVDPDSFFRLARRAIAEKEIQSDPVVLRRYFTQHGIDLSPPSSFSFNYEAKSLVVNSTRENLDRIGALLPAPPPAPPVLFDRVYRLGANDVFGRMRRSIGADESQRDFEVLRNFLTHNGVDLTPPSSLFYSYGEKSLIVRSTKENLGKVDRLIAEVTSAK